MKVNFTLYRSKYPDQEIITDEIEYPIEDTILPSLDSLISNLVTSFAQQKIDVIKKFGLAYIGNMRINSIEINNKDNLELNEDGFRSYLDDLFTDVNLKWVKDVIK